MKAIALERLALTLKKYLVGALDAVWLEDRTTWQNYEFYFPLNEAAKHGHLDVVTTPLA
jgi:hypothetical protein